MDFKMWVLVVAALSATVNADEKVEKQKTNLDPQKQPDTTGTPKTNQKRYDNYQMKDMIVYLTPTQIKDIESGKAVLEPQFTYPEPKQNQQYIHQEPPLSQYQPTPQIQQTVEQQNYLNQKGQEINQQITNLKAIVKSQLQLKDADQFENIQKLPEPQAQSVPNQAQQQSINFVYQEQKVESTPHQSYQQSFSNLFAQQSPQWQPDNYAQQYFYPNDEQLKSKFSQEAQQPIFNEQISVHESQPKWSPIAVSPKFQFIPYEYNHQAQIEAQQLLENQWSSLNQFNADQSKDLNTQQLTSAQIINQFKDQTEHLQLQANRLNADQFDSIRHHSEEVQELQKKAVEKINELHKAAKENENRLIAQQKEAQRLDAELEHEEFKAEVAKAEEKFFGPLRNEPRPFFKVEQPIFLSHPQPETGFKPLYTQKNKEEHSSQYALKFNEAFAQEIKESEQRNQLEKAKAYAHAAAISKSPPVILHKEVKVTRPIEVAKHVAVPQPFYVPVPAPFEVKVPQPYPYPVPLEIVRHVPIPIVKTEKIEVEKPVPYEVEKHVPVPVTKNVYIPVDKPYFVERVVPVEVKKEILVEKVIHKPQKFTIVKHIYSHK